MREDPVCPKGHISTEMDYCSECGARLQGGGSVRTEPVDGSGIPATEICPDCGTLREQSDVAFCEVCGYNFVTGSHGEVGIMPVPPSVVVETVPDVVADPQPQPAANPVSRTWRVLVSVNGDLGGPDSPQMPSDVAPFTVDLEHPVNLIGRKDEVRGIFPEISIPADEAVSRRHALLQKDDERGLLLRDIGAANGTRLNGKDLTAMVDYVLNDGDVVELGHWSCLRIEAVS